MPKAAKKAAPPDQPARDNCWVGARPTCRKRQYIDREGRRRRENGAKSCSDAAARPGRPRPPPCQARLGKSTCLCTHGAPPSRTRKKKKEPTQKKKKEPTGYTLYSHPLHNAWVLANEPTEGDTANCVYQTVDVNIDMSSTALHSQRLPRAAKDGTLQKLAAHNTISLHLVTPVLVQVAPTGPSGELTVHYGDTYDRSDYPPTGLRWETLPMHPGRPPLHNPALADHLDQGTTEFTPDTWRGFGIHSLRSGDYIKTKKGKLFKPSAPVGKMASAYRPGTNEIMQPVQEDIMALLQHHGLTGDDAARALMLCSAPIDAASASLCVAELKTCPTIPTVVTHGKQRNIDGPPTIPRVTMHDPVTNVPDAAPGTPPPPPHPGVGASPPP